MNKRQQEDFIKQFKNRRYIVSTLTKRIELPIKDIICPSNLLIKQTKIFPYQRIIKNDVIACNNFILNE